jgi:branched-chain amino acid transport system ATP-binding protein
MRNGGVEERMGTMNERRIEAKGLSAGYGTMAVVRDLDLHVDSGEVVALLGANGAGKTTTLLTLAGELPPLAGEVLVNGQATAAPMHTRCRDGMSFLTEERSVIMSLSTRDNLRLADVDATVAIELFPELEPLMKRTAGLLSGGEQQMLSLARALGRGPTILLADELSLGLAPLVVKRLLEAVRRAADDLGVAVLLVEQHVRQAMAYADRVYVMEHGRVALSGSVDEVRSKVNSIEAAYLSGPDQP